ncbi:hypothetical protein [Roseimicrobium sp. ORNL1]|uniref:hypothetical protein n=1 Tax=Roseimicrobium sp. ORNL1 TaxID=2711231 RepID=UPI0013E184F1|nr:hypothetical protein [Roseimicrobium sp. ORNL1]QIF03444.1 hypothetical protein G5S37_18565 [Roseimicrobium sp. ORNL1]
MNASTSFRVVLLLLALSLSSPAFADTKAPAGVDPSQTSTDADYGHSKEKPVKVGDKDPLKGPRAERDYLDTLRDDDGKPVRYSRIGSFGAGPDGHIIDGYNVETSTGKKFVIYIDMYHPESDPVKQPAPTGLWKAK